MLDSGETYSVSMSYDQFGRLQSTTGPDGSATTYHYDALGRRIMVEDPSGQTQFEYDTWDNLIALTDANNQRTRFEYDAVTGRLTKELRPMNQATTYGYDNLGRLWKIIDATLQITQYGYESQGRLQTITYAGGKTVTLSYDADGNLAGYDDGTTSATSTYDDLGRKLSETVDYGTFTKTFSYTYYQNGLKKTFTGPDGITYEYAYGNNNELREVRIPGVGAITIPEYTWKRPAKMVFPGGSAREYTYDPLMRLKQLTANDPGQNIVLDYQYTYDSIGNILNKATEHGNYAYSYDALSRLTSADNPVQEDETYTYDDVGNRLTAAGVEGNWSYNTNNELLGFADVTYEYDDNGNMTKKSAGPVAVNYIYNAVNRLIRVADELSGLVIAEYYYDPFGRRLWKDIGGTRTYYFYADEGLIAEYDANGTEIRTYGYTPDSTWTTDPLFLKQGVEYYFYQNDHLGTPQKLVAMNGAVVWAATYTAFGKATVDIETVTNNLRFPGQYEDVETGLHYNWFRYYDPGNGRYVQKDPIGFFGGDMNLYGYAVQDPLNRYDPHGLGPVAELMPKVVERAPDVISEVGRHPEIIGPATVFLLKLTATVVVYGGAAMALVGVTPSNSIMSEAGEQALLEQAMVQRSPSPEPYFQPQHIQPQTEQDDDDDCCTDDLGNVCDECRKVIIYTVRPLIRPDTPVGHAFVAYEVDFGGVIDTRADGWTIVSKPVPIWKSVAGIARPNEDLIDDAEALKVYRACPDSVSILRFSIERRRYGGVYQIENIGGMNCFGWAFQVVQDAGFTPPRSPDMPFGPFDHQIRTSAFIAQFNEFVNQLIDEITGGRP